MKTEIINENDLCIDYVNGIAIEHLCSKYKIGKIKVNDILKRNNVKIYSPSERANIKEKKVSNPNIRKYIPSEGKTYIAICSLDGKEFDDYENKSGCLTNYLKKTHSIEIPSLFKRNSYYMSAGDYWLEQYYTFEERDLITIITKKCSYCDWTTSDLENKSGQYKVHIEKEHNIDIQTHLKNYPEDITYFTKDAKKIKRKKDFENEDNYIICQICGKKFKRISISHVKNCHNMTIADYNEKFNNPDLCSENFKETMKVFLDKGRLNITKSRFISKFETEIQNFIKSLGFVPMCNRQILGGKEIDILVEDKKIGFEINGCKWHTEWFGKKDKYYHLNKIKTCNDFGYNLIHIFEDEFIYHKDVVLNKIKHLLGASNSIKIGGRKCKIQKITKDSEYNFLEKYHIQGSGLSTFAYGAFYNNELIAVMSFKEKIKNSNEWELVRFCSNYNYICQGIGSKLLTHFIKNNNPNNIVTFADRRWTLDKDNNIYTKMGFKLDGILNPEYRYYNEKIDKFKRFHKFGFRKQFLNKKYNLPLSMTETEMVKTLGYDRIWDCGLFRYKLNCSK